MKDNPPATECMCPFRAKVKEREVTCWTSGNQSYPESVSRRWSTILSCMRNLEKKKHVRELQAARQLVALDLGGGGTYCGNTSLRSVS